MNLPRPDIDPAMSTEVGPFRVWLDHDRTEVAVAVGTAVRSVTPAVMREFAAVGVAYADAARTEPDPGEIEELAKAIRAGINPAAEGLGLRPSDADRIAARTALRWMRDREARDA